MQDLKLKKAFSLVELSVVILIIGIIIAGITQSSRLIAKFTLSSARSQTESSPVNSINGLVLWLEATSQASFKESETEDHDLDPTAPGISTWRDLNQIDGTKRNATNSGAGEKPFYYANCINNLPCVRFDGSDDSLGFDAEVLTGSNYTIFVVEQRRTANAKYFLGNDGVPTGNNSLGFGYNSTDTLIISQGDIEAASSASVESYSTPTPRLHTIINQHATIPATPIVYYKNGSATPDTLTDIGTPVHTTLNSYESATIGFHDDGAGRHSFNGDIGEVIIFARSLKTEERVAVEDYLIKKWSINEAI